MSRTSHTRGWGRALESTRDIGPRLCVPKTPFWKRALRRRARSTVVSVPDARCANVHCGALIADEGAHEVCLRCDVLERVMETDAYDEDG